MKGIICTIFFIVLVLLLTATGCVKKEMVKPPAENSSQTETDEIQKDKSTDSDGSLDQGEQNTDETTDEANPELPVDEGINVEDVSHPQDTKPEKTAAGSTVQQMMRLFPARSDYQWLYQGFVDYSHKMRLNSISRKGNEVLYNVTGKVADLSDGASNRDYSIRVTYRAASDVLVQEKTEETMMDSDFNRLELIRAPLAEGTSWVQSVMDKEGKKRSLACQITDIRKDGNQKIYSVYYKDQSSPYYEKRQIKEGVGIISFEKWFLDTKKSGFAIGYSLIYSMTGYTKNLVLNRYLPSLNKILYYNGLAEYGHKGTVRRISAGSDAAVYEFQGIYQDGSGEDDRFAVRYYLDYIKGTITEKVISNTRGSKKEVNSKLHNLVILKYPLEKGKTWSHKTQIDGQWYTVNAKIEEVNDTDQTVKVRYTVQGVPGYYHNTYFEIRVFQQGFGMIHFSNLMPGNLPINEKDEKDPKKLQQAFDNHMFGYSLSK